MIKHIILIEDMDLLREKIIAAFTEFLSDQKIELELTWEEFGSNADVIAAYPNGIPQNVIIILDGELTDGSSQELFPLFDEKAKLLTVVISAGQFLEIAKENGLKNQVYKAIGFENLLISEVLSLCQQP